MSKSCVKDCVGGVAAEQYYILYSERESEKKFSEMEREK